MVKESRPAVAIFGGSFDPPHQGHQHIVRQALSLLEIDRLIIVPAYLNPFKDTSHASAAQRLAWCRLLFDDIPNVTVDDYEIRQGESIRTAQSVSHFSQQYDVCYLIVGSDNLSTLTTWHAFEWLNAHLTWVVATREGYPLNTSKLRSWRVLELDTPASSSAIRETMSLHHVDTKIKHSVYKTLKEKTYDNQ